jgi:hypothetical protein
VKIENSIIIMQLLLAFLVVLCCCPNVVALQLTDGVLTASFNSQPTDVNFGTLIEMHTNDVSSPVINNNKSNIVWTVSAQHVQPAQRNQTIQTLQSNAPSAIRSLQSVTATSATFVWTVPVEKCQLKVTLVVLISSKHHLTYRISFKSKDQLAIWAWSLFPASTTLLSNGNVFEPTGFGVVHQNAKQLTASYSRIYPQATMQWMAAMVMQKLSASTTYVAAHDPNGNSKTLTCSVDTLGETVRFSISATPPHAGVPLSTLPENTLSVDYPIVVALIDSNDWFDAASIYRSFALATADWTQKGPIASRTDVPAWSQNLTVWVNSHWQENDIFNISGGAPNVVEERVLNIVNRFGLEPNTMGFHWYEWDTLGYVHGSNYTICGSEITCGFDTHYPEYFPARQGFERTLRKLQKYVRVTPYVNGRIFDQATSSWTANNGAARKAAAKNVNKTNPHNLSLYNESYGSKAVFAVMCPHTNYWQHTMSTVVGTLTNKYETDGVYVDQIAAAGPRPCWDPTHNHTLGGGNHWTSGYNQMLQDMRAVAGPTKLLLTESNAESFMGNLDMYLTLVGFASGNLSMPSHQTSNDSLTYIVPAFQSVYGGYALFMGAEYFQKDLSPNPNVFAAKIANQLLFGAQIGWFSLGGRSNIVEPKSGLYELLMDAKYDDEIIYLRLLSSVKRKCNLWLTHGRAMRGLKLIINGTTTDVRRTVVPAHPRYHRRMANDDKVEKDVSTTFHSVDLSYDSVMSATWMSADDTSLLILITVVDRYTPATVQSTIDVSKYGFIGAGITREKFNVFDVPSTGNGPDTLVGTYAGGKVELNAVLGARSIKLLRVERA